MNTNTANYEECYKILELEFGAPLQQINKAWRRLSLLHHPDKHNNNPSRYQQALERQKKINNARDVLRKWLDQNPGVTPPRSSSSSHTANTGGTTAGTNGSTANSQSNYQQQQNQQQYSWSSAGQSWQRYGNNRNHSSGDNGYSWYYGHSKQEPKTAPFSPPPWELSPLQNLIKTLDAWFENKEVCSDPTIPAIIAFIIVIIAPMYAYAGAINLVFPEMVGHYPEWLSTLVFFSGIATTIYIFRWYFVESELIKLQEKTFQYISDKNSDEVNRLLKEILRKYCREATTWSFAKCESGQTATLLFEEEILPDMKRPRRVQIVYRIIPAAGGASLDLAFRVKSPIHSFACNKIVQEILKELKAQLTLLS